MDVLSRVLLVWTVSSFSLASAIGRFLRRQRLVWTIDCPEGTDLGAFETRESAVEAGFLHVAECPSSHEAIRARR